MYGHNALRVLIEQTRLGNPTLVQGDLRKGLWEPRLIVKNRTNIGFVCLGRKTDRKQKKYTDDTAQDM